MDEDVTCYVHNGGEIEIDSNGVVGYKGGCTRVMGIKPMISHDELIRN